MKKLILIITLAMVFAFSSMAMAEVPQVTVGLKTWLSTWETKGELTTIKSDYGIMYGPSVNVRYDKFFAGASYLLGTFSFPKEGETYFDGSSFEEKDDADRTDLDISAGYYFHPNAAAFIGYKSIDFDFKFSTIECDEFGDCLEDSGKVSIPKIKGPVLGITGHYPIGVTRLVMFGNLSYVMLSTDIEDEFGDTTTEDVTGPAIELGGAYAMENIPLSVSVGYKYQSYEADTSGSEPVIFSGLTFGVNYTIR